jgi:hypothetical protein
MIILKNNLNGPLILNDGFSRPLRLDAGAKIEVNADVLMHPQIQDLLEKKILSKSERKG